MRFKLMLSKTGNTMYIPVDYQYFIGAWIYRIISAADKELASFLHDKGFGEGNKRFKLFHYSPLDLRPYKLWKEKGLFEIQGGQVELSVSFHIHNIAESFIRGLFLHQQIYIGNRFNGMDFTITRVEALPPPRFERAMRYRLHSPLVLSVKQPGGKALYLVPDHDDYGRCFLQHLAEKMKSVPAAMPELAGPASVTVTEEWRFKRRGPFKSHLHAIKPGTPEQTRVRGFTYDFELTAPVEIHEMAYNCGFGEKNATGFGWAEILDYPVYGRRH